MSKLYDLAKELHELLFHYDEDPQWKALRRKAKAAMREAERSYTIEMMLRVVKGGGQVQLVNEFSTALAGGGGVKIQPGTYDVKVTRRPKLAQPKPKPHEDPPEKDLTCHDVRNQCRAQCTREEAEAATAAKLVELRKSRDGFSAFSDTRTMIDNRINELEEGGFLICPTCGDDRVAP